MAHSVVLIDDRCRSFVVSVLTSVLHWCISATKPLASVSSVFRHLNEVHSALYSVISWQIRWWLLHALSLSSFRGR